LRAYFSLFKAIYVIYDIGISIAVQKIIYNISSKGCSTYLVITDRAFGYNIGGENIRRMVSMERRIQILLHEAVIFILHESTSSPDSMLPLCALFKIKKLWRDIFIYS